MAVHEHLRPPIGESGGRSREPTLCLASLEGHTYALTCPAVNLPALRAALPAGEPRTLRQLIAIIFEYLVS